MPTALRAFHPKASLIESRSAGAAFVGSSNVSRSALQLRARRGRRALGASARELTYKRLEAYARRVQQAPQPPPAGDAISEALEPPPAPHVFHEEALAALAQARAQGRQRALEVLTRLSKSPRAR